MSDRPTPETDAVAEKINFGVDIDFARKLEQERDEARAERDILRSNKMSDPLLETTFKHLNRERDEACQVANGLAKQVERLRKERDEALMALKCIDEAILVMKPRHIGQPDMDGRYPCWSVWLPKSGRVERKSLQDALLEFAAQIKEETK